MNRTLEATARAIFKSWFVDFDPVRAKMDGRQPEGMDAETAALFPTAFEDSELGMIPKGWRVGQIGDLISIERESLKPNLYPEEQFDYYSIPAFDAGQSPLVELGKNIKSNKYLVFEKSILLSKLNPHIPRIWLPNPSLDYRSICSTEFIVALPKANIGQEYVYSLFTANFFLNDFKTLVTGTSGSHQRVKPEDLLSMQTLIPFNKVVSVFSNTIKTLYQKKSENLNQSRFLSTLRDTLLPKLMSGEIRVVEAEKMVEDVA